MQNLIPDPQTVRRYPDRASAALSPVGSGDRGIRKRIPLLSGSDPETVKRKLTRLINDSH